MFVGSEIARADTVLGDIGKTASNVNNSAKKIMGYVVTVAALIFGGFTVVKCIMAIQKKQQKEAVLYGVGALVAFIVAALFLSGSLTNIGNTWGSGESTLSEVIGSA